jgi:hypothetical protein
MAAVLAPAVRSDRKQCGRIDHPGVGKARRYGDEDDGVRNKLGPPEGRRLAR